MRPTRQASPMRPRRLRSGAEANAAAPRAGAALLQSWLLAFAALLRFIVSAQARLVALLVDELTNPFLASVTIEEVGRLLGANQIILGIVISHLANTADGVLG